MSMLIRLMFMVLLAATVRPQITECSTYIENLINDIMDFKIAALPIPSLMYSGTTTNDPGQLDQCIASNYSYYLVFIKNTTSMTEWYTGLCIPSECLASDIEMALQFLHCKVYEVSALTNIDMVARVGGVMVIAWAVVLIGCSCYVSMSQPVINEYLVNDKSDSNDTGSVSAQTSKSNEGYSEVKGKELGVVFHFYEGYRKLFKIPKQKNMLSLVLFLAVVSFAVSVQFSYRQNIAQNKGETNELLNSFWGIFVCNIEITLHTIVFVLGFRLAHGVANIRKFTSIGRHFFDLIMRKWLVLILMSLFVYSVCTFLINEPLSKLWNLNNGKDCANYIWEIWFVFRNLQLDCRICLPWFSLLEGELLFTILSAPFVLIFKINRKLGHFMLLILVGTSLIISYEIIKDEAIVFEPAKLMNAQKQYYIDYQGNAFVRLGAYALGLFFGLLVTQGSQPHRHKNLENKICQKVSHSPPLQYFLTFSGLALMTWCYTNILPYLQTSDSQASHKPAQYLLLTPLGFVLGLGLFILPCCWQGTALLTRLTRSTIGYSGWVHLDRIALAFYLLAPMTIGYSTYSSQNTLYYDMWTVFTYLLGDGFFIYFLSIVVTAAVENQLIPMVSWLQVKVLGKQSLANTILIEQL